MKFVGVAEMEQTYVKWAPKFINSSYRLCGEPNCRASLGGWLYPLLFVRYVKKADRPKLGCPPWLECRITCRQAAGHAAKGRDYLTTSFFTILMFSPMILTK